MNDTNKILGYNLQFIRKKKKVSVKELAEKLNTTPSTIYNWEKGKYQPDIESLLTLSQILEVSLDELFGNKFKTYSLEKDNLDILKKYKLVNTATFFKELNMFDINELNTLEKMIQIVKKDKKN